MTRIKNESVVVTNFLAVLNEGMDNLTDDIFTASQENLVKNQSIDRGILLKSGIFRKSFLHKEIIYPVSWADIIEFGASAHDINPGVLVPWVKRKLRISDDSHAWAVATSIAKNIEALGIEPKPYLRPAVDEAITKEEF